MGWTDVSHIPMEAHTHARHFPRAHTQATQMHLIHTSILQMRGFIIISCMCMYLQVEAGTLSGEER
jgi:hypothetical protein